MNKKINKDKERVIDLIITGVIIIIIGLGLLASIVYVGIR
jgi:hypothetical protein